MVYGDQCRRQAATQSVLDHFIVLKGAEEHADRGLFVSFAHVPVERFEVETELNQILRLKAADLELNGDEAVEPPMEEEKIEREVSVALRPEREYGVLPRSAAWLPGRARLPSRILLRQALRVPGRTKGHQGRPNGDPLSELNIEILCVNFSQAKVA